jgi:hypothetical protein
MSDLSARILFVRFYSISCQQEIFADFTEAMVNTEIHLSSGVAIRMIEYQCAVMG